MIQSWNKTTNKNEQKNSVLNTKCTSYKNYF